MNTHEPPKPWTSKRSVAFLSRFCRNLNRAIGVRFFKGIICVFCPCRLRAIVFLLFWVPFVVCDFEASPPKKGIARFSYNHSVLKNHFQFFQLTVWHFLNKMFKYIGFQKTSFSENLCPGSEMKKWKICACVCVKRRFPPFAHVVQFFFGCFSLVHASLQGPL